MTDVLKLMTTKELFKVQDIVVKEIMEGIRSADSLLTGRLLDRILEELVIRKQYTKEKAAKVKQTITTINQTI